MERELASFDIYVIVSELQDFIGDYIEKIIQPSRNEILLRVKHPETNEKESLYIRNSELLCRTRQQFTAPTKPSMFAMTLRKYILNGKIKAITQHEFDRIITIDIQRKEDRYLLIIELFKKGNIILVDEQGVIIQSLITQHWAHRTLRTHEAYQSPPSQKNPFMLPYDEFSDLVKTGKRDLVRTLAVTLNLSGTYAEELCTRAGIDKNACIDDLNPEVMNRLYTTLQSLLEVFTNKEFHPAYVKQNGEYVDLLPFPLQSYTGKELVPAERFSQCLEMFIQRKTRQSQASVEHQKTIEKLQRQLSQQTQSIEEFTRLIQQKQREGDAMYMHLTECQELLDDIGLVLKEKEKGEGIQRITSSQMVRAFDPLSNTLVVLLQDIEGNLMELQLDFRKTAVENAQQAYENAKKYKEKIDGAKQAIAETKQAIEHLKEKTMAVETEEEQPGTVKRFWFEPYRWCLSSEGNIIVGGRDAKTNDIVVKKYLKDGDRYIHADVHGAASCIVKNSDIHGDSLPVSPQTLEEACRFAACYSKAWKQYGEAQAYWVLPEQVSKTPESGEFLPRGAFMIRGKRNYVRCPMELAIGEIMVDETKKIMAGSLSAVKTHASRYVVIQPGEMKSSSLAHIIAKVFSVSSDTLMRVLPPGNSRVVKTVGFELPGV